MATRSEGDTGRWFVLLATGVAAIITGSIAISRARQQRLGGKGVAVVGVILGVAGSLVGGLGTLLGLAGILR